MRTKHMPQDFQGDWSPSCPGIAAKQKLMLHSHNCQAGDGGLHSKQVMGKIPLNKDNEFIVGEDKVLDYIMASLFLGLFLYGTIDAILHHFTKFTYLNFVFGIALAPALIFFARARNKRVYIRINKTGIYQDEQFVTNWSNLLNVYLDQKEIVLSIQDNFILVVEYLKDGFEQGFRRKIPLTNTQDKSEEDVLEAVHFFWKEDQAGTA